MPKNYKWLYSFATYAFDTPDQNIHLGEYALANDELGGYLIHNPKRPDNFLRVQTLDVTGLTEVHQAGQKAYDVFEDPDTGNKEYYPCDLQVYRDLAKPNAESRIKIKL